MKTGELRQEINDWIEGLRTSRRAENTLKLYQHALEGFLNFLIEQEIDEVNRDAGFAYIEAMEKEREANKQELIENKKLKSINGVRPLTKISTINSRLRAINKFFRDHDQDTLPYLKDESDNFDEDTLTEKEYWRILEWANRLEKQKIGLILETLANTGMRISELKDLNVHDLKTRTPTVTNKGKTRTVFLPRQLTNKLEEYCKENGIKSGIIFHGKDPSRMLSPRYIQDEFKYIAGKARGIPLKKAHPHGLRHFYSQRFDKACVAEEIINKTKNREGIPLSHAYFLLGHSNRDVALTYKKPSKKQLLKEVDMIERYYNTKHQEELKQATKKPKRKRRKKSPKKEK